MDRQCPTTLGTFLTEIESSFGLFPLTTPHGAGTARQTRRLRASHGALRLGGGRNRRVDFKS